MSVIILRIVPTIEITSRDKEFTAICTKSPEIKTPKLSEVQRIKKSCTRHNSEALRKRVLISNASAIYGETPRPSKRRYHSECLGGRDHHPVTSTPVAGIDLTCLPLNKGGSYNIGNPDRQSPVIFIRKFLQTKTSISELCIDSDIGIQQRIKDCLTSPIR